MQIHITADGDLQAYKLHTTNVCQSHMTSPMLFITVGCARMNIIGSRTLLITASVYYSIKYVYLHHPYNFVMLELHFY
jgi:hypothetical protein